ncbi:MAG: hypothetical protein M3534_17125 [Actinomycetota bacterium]|nr:hypothetical protein [Actinomycetota bacterium]
MAVNRGTLNEMREGRTTHERPQVVITAEYRHGTLVEVVISRIGLEALLSRQPLPIGERQPRVVPLLKGLGMRLRYWTSPVRGPSRTCGGNYRRHTH